MKAFPAGGRVQVVVDDSNQICLQVGSSPLFAVTNVDVLQEALTLARRHVRITEDNAAEERTRAAHARAARLSGVPAPPPPADDRWDPSGYVPRARRGYEP